MESILTIICGCIFVTAPLLISIWDVYLNMRIVNNLYDDIKKNPLFFKYMYANEKYFYSKDCIIKQLIKGSDCVYVYLYDTVLHEPLVLKCYNGNLKNYNGDSIYIENMKMSIITISGNSARKMFMDYDLQNNSNISEDLIGHAITV